MNTIKRIAKNTAALFAAQFVTAILSLVLSIFIARSLGDVIFGKYSFALAFTAIFALLVITINVMGYPADTKNVVYLFGIYTLIVSYSAIFKVTFRAFEKMELEDVCEGERILL